MSFNENTAFFRCDASQSTGTGHVMRCLSLADKLNENGWSCSFLTNEETIQTAPFLKEKGYAVVTSSIPNEKTKILIVDHYGLDKKFEQESRGWAEKIIVIDDLANREHDCDVIMDQTYQRNSNDYKELVPDSCVILTGSKYAILKSEYADKREKALKERQIRAGRIENVLISMGGTNPENITGQILAEIGKFESATLSIDIVMRSTSEHIQDVQKLSKEINEQSSHKANIIFDANNMADLMIKADIAIGAGGTTSWERCCLGLAAIMIEIADNQSLIAKNLHNAGAVINLGQMSTDEEKINNALNMLHDDPKKLIKMSDRASSVCDGKGLDRLYEEIKNVCQ